MEGEVFVVNIIDKPYKLKVKSGDESVFKAAGDEIGNVIKTYSTSYGIKDKQDLLSMALLHFATELARMKEESVRRNDINTLTDSALEELMELEQAVKELIER